MAGYIRRDIENGRRLLVVSDIHGHSGLLSELLDRAGFSEDDLLVIVGDIIEKGPDSLGALRLVMKLCERGNVVALAGNVDLARRSMLYELSADNADELFDYLLEIRSWNQSIFDEMTRELGFVADSAGEFLSAKTMLLERFKPELEFLASLPTVFETQNYVFVHGGLRDTVISDNAERSDAELLKYDNFYAVAPEFPKYVVVGHYPVTLYDDRICDCTPRVDKRRKIIAIDGGCGIKKFGQLNLMIIPDMNAPTDALEFLAADDLQRVKALDPQTGSTDHINIRWIDRRIETLEKYDGYRKIRHLPTGHECLIPDDYVYDDEHSADYSDYILPVTAGEILSLVATTPLGYIVKKNGVIGLYKGRIEDET